MISWIVYKHTSMKSGKSYIGLTKKSWIVRWQHHCHMSRAGSSFHFHRAISLYGEDNWTHDVLAEDIDTLEEAQTLEKYYIKKYDTFENGYNMTLGGECVSRSGPTKHHTVYEWVHEEHGRRSCTIWELMQEFEELVHSALANIVNPERPEKTFKGWQQYIDGVALISTYKEVKMSLISDNGMVDYLTASEFVEKYEVPRPQALKLFRGYTKKCHGWQVNHK